MHVKIIDRNGFKAMTALTKAASDDRVQEIEGNGCEEGRVLIHLHAGYRFAGYASRTKSVGNARDVRHVMAIIESSDQLSGQS